MQILNQLLERFNGLSDTDWVIVTIAILIVFLVALVTLALKRGVRTESLALPFGVFFLFMSILVIKTSYDRGDGSPLWTAFWVFFPFLGYFGLMGQFERAKGMEEEAKERKRTGKRPERSKFDMTLRIVLLVILAGSFLIRLIMSK